MRESKIGLNKELEHEEVEKQDEKLRLQEKIDETFNFDEELSNACDTKKITWEEYLKFHDMVRDLWKKITNEKFGFEQMTEEQLDEYFQKHEDIRKEYEMLMTRK